VDIFMHVSTTSLNQSIRHIQTLVLSFHPLLVIETVEEERVQTLLQTATQDMNQAMYEWSVAQGLMRSPGSQQGRWTNEYAPPGGTKLATIEGTDDPLKVLKHIQDMNSKAIYWLKDFAPHLEDATVARQFRELTQLFSQNQSAIVLSGYGIRLPAELAHDAVYVDLKLPGRDELQQLVNDVVRSLKGKGRLQTDPMEMEVQELVKALVGMTLKQARQAIAYAVMEDGKLTIEDVSKILHRKAQMIRDGGVLEYFPVESSKTLKLGGFAGLKKWLEQARMGYSSQAQHLNLPSPKGVLIVGIQGCGKSLAAKTIAQSWKLPLLKLDAGRLYDKFIGESERNFRQAIALAESMAPAVLWIDEIEKSFTTGSGETDGGLSRRLFGSLLTWMQEKSQEVFVVATANDLSQVPPELLRKGRFDEVFFVDLPDEQERGVILQTHLLSHNQVPRQFDFATLVHATAGFSGAEIEQAVIAALYHALLLKQPLDTPLLLQTIKSTVPLSVSRREEVQQLRAIAKERFVSVR
jgi:cytidylate kinase